VQVSAAPRARGRRAVPGPVAFVAKPGVRQRWSYRRSVSHFRQRATAPLKPRKVKVRLPRAAPGERLSTGAVASFEHPTPRKATHSTPALHGQNSSPLLNAPVNAPILDRRGLQACIDAGMNPAIRRTLSHLVSHAPEAQSRNWCGLTHFDCRSVALSRCDSESERTCAQTSSDRPRRSRPLHIFFQQFSLRAPRRRAQDDFRTQRGDATVERQSG
jgi:hypothetical protein